MIAPNRWHRLVVVAAFALALAAPPAAADFPYARAGADTGDYADLYLAGEDPDDVGGERFKYAASPDPANTVNNALPTELGGVRGASLYDEDDELATAWKVTTGRPDVTIATLDSGIKWNDPGAMNDLRFKTRINRGEVPVPLHDRTAPLVEGTDCASFSSAYDANADGVFNLRDYACDSRVNVSDPRRVGPANTLTPQDLLIAFSNGDDADSNGYVDDMVGWDFLDDDNDPFDDVQYGHGTGEAEGSTGEADNGATIGSCANCMVIHMRVGDSFIADVNRFAQAVVYAVDNGVLVVQSALGTLNNSSFSRDAVDYAYDHGVTTILSAADEAAQHNNQPFLPKAILVNSVTRSPIPPPNQSYLTFNGCTNFNAKITLAIPSTSCSSDAVGVGSGLAGIIYSAAYNAHVKGALDAHPDCMLTGDGPDPGNAGPDPCVITPNEVRQLMASGTVGDEPFPDDVNFASPSGGPEPSCTPPVPGCTNPNLALQAQVDANRPTPIPASRSYAARRGHDQFYGYGRVNINRSVRALVDDPVAPSAAEVPPEAELDSPTWFEQLDPARGTIEVSGEVWARGARYGCRVYVAPGHYPNNALSTASPPGDFTPVPAGGGACDGAPRTAAADGKLAEIDVAELEARFPPGTDFGGPEPLASPVTGNGRPNADPHGFVVKVVATMAEGPAMSGEDRRAAYLLRDRDMLADFPRTIRGGGQIGRYGVPTGDGESSPAFADLDGDNRNELVFATTDGFVHALRPNGRELPGWPVRGDVPGFISAHTATAAFESGEVSANLGGAMLSAVAVVDADRDGAPEVYVADLEGKVYGWSAAGERIFTEETNGDYSGAPLAPFENVRYEEGQSSFRRTQHGFVASPVLADVDRDDGGELEIVAAAMDRHVYAWEARDSSPDSPGGAAPLDGWPVLVVDPAKVASIDPRTHAVTFRPDAASEQQGAIVDTPAVADLDDDDDVGANEAPEIVIGTNEEYAEQINADNVTTATFPPIGAVGVTEPGNSRLYALRASGDDDGNPLLDGSTLHGPGWPFAVGIVTTGLLPVVGEGITGNPIVGAVDCPSGDIGPNVGTLANNGPAYVLNGDASSCYGNGPSGRPNALESDFAPSAQKVDTPVLPAVGHPAFGALGPAPGLSFLAPAAGLNRALDLALPEYQVAGQDFLAVWNTSTPDFRPGFPATVNDLQFLTGPSIADLDGGPGEEIVAGTASKDLAAFNGVGLPVDPARWPKASTDWTVANPLIGSFGTLDTDEDSTKVVVAMTRSGYINAYATDAPACSPSSWPRFHHDNANSGDQGRDAVLPGRPVDAAIAGGELEFTAPGDDLLCGTADHYEIVTSAEPIDEQSFGSARELSGAPEPVAAGDAQTYAVPGEAERYVAVRAVDEQGNVGRPAVVDFDAPPPGDGEGDGSGSEGASGSGSEGAGPDGGGASGACVNSIAGTAGKDRLGGTGAGDRIRGRAGADRIKGRGGEDCLSGQGGADRIGGGAGADGLKGGRGKDHLRGGAGDDVIRARRGARDRIDCGPGDDVAYVDRTHDRVRNCERVRSR